MAKEFCHEGTTEGWIIWDGPAKKIGMDLKVCVLNCMEDRGHALYGIRYHELMDAKSASVHLCNPVQNLDDLRDLVNYIDQQKLRTTASFDPH